MKFTQDMGVWKNMVGQTFGLAAMRTQNLRVSATISGYAELHDIVPQFMSWQMWRGNLGIGFYIENLQLNRWLPSHSRFIFQLGWYHESQHVTDMKTYRVYYTTSDTFDNAVARSFEYFVLQANYTWTSANKKWQVLFSPGYRYFTTPLVGTERAQRSAMNVEVGFHRRIRTAWDMYMHVFYERVQNDYISKGYPYLHVWNRQPLLYRQLEAGLNFKANNNRQCGVFMRYNYSNGRGLDFLKTRQEIGGGFRFIL